jgi:hypothetical protein
MLEDLSLLENNNNTRTHTHMNEQIILLMSNIEKLCIDYHFIIIIIIISEIKFSLFGK